VVTSPTVLQLRAGLARDERSSDAVPESQVLQPVALENLLVVLDEAGTHSAVHFNRACALIKKWVGRSIAGNTTLPSDRWYTLYAQLDKEVRTAQTSLNDPGAVTRQARWLLAATAAFLSEEAALLEAGRRSLRLTFQGNAEDVRPDLVVVVDTAVDTARRTAEALLRGSSSHGWRWIASLCTCDGIVSALLDHSDGTVPDFLWFDKLFTDAGSSLNGPVAEARTECRHPRPRNPDELPLAHELTLGVVVPSIAATRRGTGSTAAADLFESSAAPSAEATLVRRQNQYLPPAQRARYVVSPVLGPLVSPRLEPLAALALTDRSAQERLLAEIHPMVLRYCRGRLSGQETATCTADDLAQEICLAVLRSLPNYTLRGLSFRAFVYRIGADKVTDAFRAIGRNRAEPMADLPDVQVVHDGPEQRLILGELTERLGALLHRLTPRQREVLVLRIAVGLSAEETATAVGSTPGAVRVTQHRALNRLRRIVIGTAGPDDEPEEG
jgi:RNA polymerase sigma-70 factor (ECF subfamily)